MEGLLSLQSLLFKVHLQSQQKDLSHFLELLRWDSYNELVTYQEVVALVCKPLQHESIVHEIEEALRKEIIAASTLSERPR